jgi:hypothetical protein
MLMHLTHAYARAALRGCLCFCLRARIFFAAAQLRAHALRLRAGGGGQHAKTRAPLLSPLLLPLAFSHPNVALGGIGLYDGRALFGDAVVVGGLGSPVGGLNDGRAHRYPRLAGAGDCPKRKSSHLPCRSSKIRGLFALNTAHGTLQPREKRLLRGPRWACPLSIGQTQQLG